MRIHYTKLCNMNHALSLSVFIAFKGTNFQFLFAITADWVVLCGGPKMSPFTSSIVQIILYLWSFEIKIIIWKAQGVQQ